MTVEELTKLRQEHILQRDFHQKEISKIYQQIQKASAPELNTILQNRTWDLKEFDNTYSHLRYYLLCYLTQLEETFFDINGTSIELEKGLILTYIPADTYNTFPTARIIFDYNTFKKQDVTKIIEKYKLTVNFQNLIGEAISLLQVLGDKNLPWILKSL